MSFLPSGAGAFDPVPLFSADQDSRLGVKNSHMGNLDLEGFCSFLRRHFPTATALNIQATTGISASTADKWFRGRAPNGDHLLKLAAAFGPMLLLASMHKAPEWLKVAGQADEKQKLERTIIEAATRAAEL